jgi:flagellin-like hook-associated protein FlgL
MQEAYFDDDREIGSSSTGTRTSPASFSPLVPYRIDNSARSSLATIQTTLDRVLRELGSIAVSQTGLEIAVKNLATPRKNSLAAESQITDADIATESSNPVTTQILQQAGAAVLA